MADLAMQEERAELRPQQVLVWLIGGFAAVFLIWAWWAKLDEVTTGQGQVVPSRQEQVIQSLEGGILRALEVQADEIVEQGQVLAQLHPAGTEADVDEVRATLLARQARLARLTAEVGETQPIFPDSVSARPDLIAEEMALFHARRAAYDRSLALIHESRGLLEEELAATDRLSELGASSRMDVVRLKRQIVELNMKEDDLSREYLVSSREELSKVRAEVEAMAAELRGLEDRFARLTIRSPVRGIVKDIVVTTQGGVIPPNGSLMTIVPIDDQLRVEARVSPRDIAFIRPGLPATVKITAYDYAIYGSLEGEVTSVSPDSIRDEVDPQIQYYRVYVEADRFELTNKLGEVFPITTGMQATVDIHTGSKTVLQYLVKPFNRAAEALRER
ncbi:HlyD family efflux transporter periplasmic adaptor subunit [Tritonibacter mobilis]|uniref:HlyD family efflux transporter periplasmic adaptor subunit n=1 Tax=Tritonibacter mobilis TaxID=379347 RepID=UPI000E0CF4C7|nr:HlyD family efflux transporter periplasmic adaptor subunit [Tritonibacter mobilis]